MCMRIVVHVVRYTTVRRRSMEGGGDAQVVRQEVTGAAEAEGDEAR